MFFYIYSVGWALFFFLLWKRFVEMAMLYVKALVFFFFLVILENEKTPKNISVIYLEVAWNFLVQLL